jgi:hypothetical protein
METQMAVTEGMQPPGKMQLFEVNGALMRLEDMIRHGDGLEQHHAVRLETITAALQESPQVLMAYGLDHLDGNELVVCALPGPDSP